MLCVVFLDVLLCSSSSSSEVRSREITGVFSLRVGGQGADELIGTGDPSAGDGDLECGSGESHSTWGLSSIIGGS